jgi:hypothetical protein
LIYLGAGVAPAFFVLPMARLLSVMPAGITGGLIYSAALAGTVGLILAVVLTFPVSRPPFWTCAALLACGSAAMLPISLPLLYGTIADLVTGSTGVPIAEALRDLLARFWSFGGPVACAFHFLWRARCAPNNSFKPKPLRGSA